MQLKDWIDENLLDVVFIKDNILEVKGFGKFLVINSEREKTFDERFILILSDDEIDILTSNDEIEYLLFKFGSFWFYHHKDSDTQLNFFRYLGKATKESFNLPFLGLHGKYELLNGSRDYKDWVKKATFLGYSSLGICERQTLAGNFYFQHACDDFNIKAIHGRECKIQNNEGYEYFVKVFAKNSKGWKDLLKLHNTEVILNKEKGSFLSEQEINFSENDDLFVIINHETNLSNINFDIYNLKNTFFQFSTIEYVSDQKDQENLLNLKNYLDNYKDLIKPIIFDDCYYIDNIDSYIKPILNGISNKYTQHRSDDRWLKPYEELIYNTSHLVSNETIYDFLVSNSIDNLSRIQSECNFKLEKGNKYLPKYIMNEDEAKLYSSNEEMFFSLVEKGFLEKVSGKVDCEDTYIERIEQEVSVLQEGQVIDYFLILYDVFRYMKEICGLTSLGRGSSAGSMVAYLLNITQLDPIEYGLLFERFLSKTRVLTGSLPDIDSDIPSSYRQQVIEYLIQKYGSKNVTFIGTSQAFKLKSSLKDLLRIKGVDINHMNLLSSLITVEDNNYGIIKLIETCFREPLLKNTLDQYPNLIYDMHLILGQPRSFGMHAAGIVIFPSVNSEGALTTALDYVPLRYSEDNLVTEWSKSDIEEIGLLKADLLGLTQLDKLVRVRSLIKENGKPIVDFKDINFKDEKVFKLFKEAVTEDIFQFNTDVQKQYLLKLNPVDINDLISANALNRPGTMEINAHMNYVKVKLGEQEREPLPLIDHILKDTYSLIVFQEQVMSIYKEVTNCSMEESDRFRRVVTTLAGGNSATMEEKISKILPYKLPFIEGYLVKGFTEEQALGVWEKIMGFVKYSFNKSHAAAYALTGYWAAYYKVYFPVEFYATSLEFIVKDSKKDILLPRLINEIQESNLVKLNPPDVNKSETQYTIDFNNNTIYWSLPSIKHCGEVAVKGLLKERQQNGSFFSFQEFLSRVKGTKVNKRTVLNIILCGGFDNIENIKEEKDRIKLIKQWGEYYKVEKDVQENWLNNKLIESNHYWVILQKKLCGLGMINYNSLYKQKIKENLQLAGIEFYDSMRLQGLEKGDIKNKTITVGGIISEVIERQTKNGVLCQLKLDCNDNTIYVTLWPDFYTLHKDIIISNNNKPVFITNCNPSFDDFKKINTVKSNYNTKILTIN